ncbi:MAG: hypothetical protein OXB95_09285, partial [Rhodobacteraceae bacterium]|nr:hypothetical protein [Paracoccaceae bacterium]
MKPDCRQHAVAEIRSNVKNFLPPRELRRFPPFTDADRESGARCRLVAVSMLGLQPGGVPLDCNAVRSGFLVSALLSGVGENPGPFGSAHELLRHSLGNLAHLARAAG